MIVCTHGSPHGRQFACRTEDDLPKFLLLAHQNIPNISIYPFNMLSVSVFLTNTIHQTQFFIIVLWLMNAGRSRV